MNGFWKFPNIIGSWALFYFYNLTLYEDTLMILITNKNCKYKYSITSRAERPLSNIDCLQFFSHNIFLCTVLFHQKKMCVFYVQFLAWGRIRTRVAATAARCATYQWSFHIPRNSCIKLFWYNSFPINGKHRKKDEVYRLREIQ